MRGILCAGLSLLAACAAPAAPRERAANAPPLAGTEAAAVEDASAAPSAGAPRRSGLVIARVAGAPVDASELLGQWMHSESTVLGDYVDKLVNTRIARSEAQRLGVRVDSAEVEARYRDACAELGELVREKGHAGTPEDFVRDRLGLDPQRYFERVRLQCEDQLLAERAVRAWLQSSERATLRVIVVADAARASEVRAALAGGMSFEEAARRYSLDPSREQGGRVPPVVRSERSPLAQLVFRTAPGEVGGPLEQGGKLLLARVDEHLPGGGGSWAELGPAVLRSLAEQPIEEAEFWQWRAAMERYYEVDLSPLLELAR